MADDLNTVIKKLMDNSSGQGNDDYEHICIANHIDYTKWNNHQRDEANRPVFEVMDKFLGFTNLISRTHEFFQKSLIYYNGRPDLMQVRGDSLENKTQRRVCWEGQLGGLEGLRQKGWSVVNLLVIRRESMNRNTRTSLLAQGDNQVICGKYKLQKTRCEDEVKDAIAGIIRENNNIMAAIEAGTERLGLIINNDETLQSADYLVYGKVPIYRGSIRGLETKRWSRVTCVTNDQLPTLANTMSSISSNALTVAHFSNSPKNAIIHYNYLGNFARVLLDIHNPALKSQTTVRLNRRCNTQSPEYKTLVIYLDPCLGGACDMSLTRFQIRSFPDPLTESLSFWKVIHENGPPWLKMLSKQVGSPQMGKQDLVSFKKLIEDPSAINLKGSVNPMTMIKEQIKRCLIMGSSNMKNEVMQSALQYLNHNENDVLMYMKTITPLFPRFLSEYLSGTYLGIVQSLVSLFQNSKTIRTMFTKNIEQKIKSMIVQSEIQTLESLSNIERRYVVSNIWSCSSTKADRLRQESWGSKVYGATVPHPMELLGHPVEQSKACELCSEAEPISYYVSILVPQGLHKYKTTRGPYTAYLGSKTSETTSVLRPWERETNIPLIKRAAKLRTAIGWFVDDGSRLASGLLQNLEALTGEKWDQKIEGAKWTGSALHRFACSRQSSAGWAALSPSKLTWMCLTTDTLSTLNTINHDFMHQSLLIYAQSTIAEIADGRQEQIYYHCHIECQECLREIEEITLDTQSDFTHADVSHILEKWKPDGTEWSKDYPITELPLGKWNLVNAMEQSYHIGRACGFLYGDLKLGGDSRCDDMSIFPLSLQNKVFPRQYLDGLLEGLVRASSLHCVSRRSVAELKRPREALLGTGLYLIKEVSNHPGLQTMWRAVGFETLFQEIAHKIPPSYPMSNKDLGKMGLDYLRSVYFRRFVGTTEDLFTYPDVWIFADINDIRLFGMLSISTPLVILLYRNLLSKRSKTLIRGYKDVIICLRDPDRQHSKFRIDTKNLKRVDEEVRHASKSIIKPSPNPLSDSITWGKELSVPITAIDVIYVTKSLQKMSEHCEKYNIPRIQNPLISGLRCLQFATGSHYKLNSILVGLDIKYRDALCGGDGSGGIGSLILRRNPNARLIFNSLLNLSEVELRGSSPAPPSAITALGQPARRCVNLTDAWENPNDLSKQATWDYFESLSKKFQMKIDLITLDMECNSDQLSDEIEWCLERNIFKVLTSGGTLIYKTFLHRLLDTPSILLELVGTQFEDVQLVFTEITSSQSSEIYVVFTRRSDQNFMLSPDLRILKSRIMEIPVMRSQQEEFDRALSLSKYDMYAGVPQCFITNPLDDISVLAETMEVDSGVTAVLSETLKMSDPTTDTEMPHLWLFICLDSMLKLSAIYDKYPIPPSDTKTYNVGALLAGYYNWASVASETYPMHQRVQEMINDAFCLSWSTIKIKMKKKVSSANPNWIRNYSLRGEFHSRKVFYLDSQMAKIGQVTRCLYRVFGSNFSPPDVGKLNRLLKIFNDGLSVGRINQRIDLYRTFATNVPLPKWKISPSWDHGEIGEGGWTS